MACGSPRSEQIHNMFRLLGACFFWILLAQKECLAQGPVSFNNRDSAAGIDARITFLDGTPVGAGYTAQLYGGREGTPIDSLTPLFPTTTFRTTSLAAMGYVRGVAVPLDPLELRPGERVTLVVRTFDATTWETSTCRGESNPMTVSWDEYLSLCRFRSRRRARAILSCCSAAVSHGDVHRRVLLRARFLRNI